MKIWSFIKYACNEVNTMLGILGTFLAIICLIDFNRIFPHMVTRVLIVIAIFLITFIIAMIKVLITRNVNIDLGNGREAEITFGDIFSQSNTIVIPVNRYFDTLVDNTLIAENSVHGQFVKSIFGGNVVELDKKIEDYLVNKNIPFIINNSKLLGKKNAYPLGTIVNIEKNGIMYFLLALTDFNNDNVAFCDLNTYYTSIISLLKHINTYSQGKEVSMPLIGGGFSRLNKDKMYILRNLISVFTMYNDSMIGKLKIVLPKSDWGKVNLHTYK